MNYLYITIGIGVAIAIIAFAVDLILETLCIRKCIRCGSRRVNVTAELSTGMVTCICPRCGREWLEDPGTEIYHS